MKNLKGKFKGGIATASLHSRFTIFLACCVGISASLLAVHVLLTYLHYEVIKLPWLFRELFDVDEEESIPTWFSSSLLLLASFAVSLVFFLKRMVRDTHQFYWMLLSMGFLFMSIDEVAGFHETVNSITTYSWAIPGLLLSIVLLAGFARFLVSLPRPTAFRFIVSGLVFVGGAVGVELWTEPYLHNDNLDSLAYNLWTAVEEGMEMGGVIYFLHALNQYTEMQFRPLIHLELRQP